MSERLSLISVHAHPDDEASKGAATVHRYHEQGVHTVLVCCTGGGGGGNPHPATDTPPGGAPRPDGRAGGTHRRGAPPRVRRGIIPAYNKAGPTGPPPP